VTQELKVLLLVCCLLSLHLELLSLKLKLLPLELVLTSLNLSKRSCCVLSLSLHLNLLPLLGLGQPLKNSHHGWV
jgi:hypothetical protein